MPGICRRSLRELACEYSRLSALPTREAAGARIGGCIRRLLRGLEFDPSNSIYSIFSGSHSSNQQTHTVSKLSKLFHLLCNRLIQLIFTYLAKNPLMRRTQIFVFTICGFILSESIICILEIRAASRRENLTF